MSGLVAFVVFVARAEVTPLAAFYAGGADWHLGTFAVGNVTGDKIGRASCRERV